MKNNSWLNGDNIGRARRRTAFLQAVSVLLLLGLVYILLGTWQRYSDVKDGIRENALWSVYQLDREARRLHETVHIMLSQGENSPENLKKLSTRYDILYSRMDVLDKTKFDLDFQDDRTTAFEMTRLRNSVYGFAPVFDRIAAEGTAEDALLSQLDTDFEAITQNTEDLLTWANTKVSSDRADARDVLSALQIKSAVLVGLLAGCVVLLIVTLHRQLKSVRIAGQEFEAMAKEINDAYLGAEAGNRAKSQFMATIGHEIRTPLNAILGTAELLELGVLPANVASGIQTIRRSGTSLLEVINEILDFAKIEHGKFELELREMDLRELAESTLDIIRDRASERGNRIAFEMPEKLEPQVILSDPTRIRQVILNLLSNAVKFSNDGVVTLRFIQRTHGASHILRVEVSDQGIGIDDQGVSKLFQPFSQVDASISRKYGGTGLGLTICKEIVTALGGTIGVQSERNLGSTFWFEIPVTPTTRSACQPQPEVKEAPAALPRLRILLVEDNLVNRQVAEGFLLHLGQSVTTARDGMEATEAVRRNDFDLVLMDMQMPVMDGIEATRRIRAMGPRTHALPIIAMTANASENDRHLCEDAGMTGFQSKPVTVDRLRAIISSAGAGDVAGVATTAYAPGNARPTADATYDSRRDEIISALGEEAFDELLDSFFNDASILLGDMHQAMKAGDTDTLDRLLHTMKGVSSSIGIQSVADLAQSLRRANASSEDLTRMDAMVQQYKSRKFA